MEMVGTRCKNSRSEVDRLNDIMEKTTKKNGVFNTPFFVPLTLWEDEIKRTVGTSWTQVVQDTEVGIFGEDLHHYRGSCTLNLVFF